MGIKIIEKSHLDHGLTPDQVQWICDKFADREGFFIESVEMPEALGTVPCGLHGPVMGDEPVTDDEVTLVKRGEREYTSRIVDRAPRPTRTITVIAGPNGEDSCVLYTAFGGPLAPKEPGDKTLEGEELTKSESFWAEHALSGE